VLEAQNKVETILLFPNEVIPPLTCQPMLSLRNVVKAKALKLSKPKLTLKKNFSEENAKLKNLMPSLKKK